MEVFRLPPLPDRNAPHVPGETRSPCALTIGNFDGVHRGHQAVIDALKARAGALGVSSCVLTFEPHPREFFAGVRGEPDAAPARILTERDKLEALAEYGVDRVCIAHFNESLARLAAEEFVERIIAGTLRTRHLLIGDDFRFGAKRRGDFAMLKRAAPSLGFVIERMDTVREHGERVSSSSVRAALAAGDFERSRALLGRPYFISGHVVRGRELGRTLGFPTLNLRIPFPKPAVTGVFVVQVHGVSDAPWPAVASLGTRPAVEAGGKLLLEVHLLGFSGDLYGRLVRVEFLRRLREERHYESLELLTEQIRRDAQAAREHFGIGGGA